MCPTLKNCPSLSPKNWKMHFCLFATFSNIIFPHLVFVNRCQGTLQDGSHLIVVLLLKKEKVSHILLRFFVSSCFFCFFYVGTTVYSEAREMGNWQKKKFNNSFLFVGRPPSSSLSFKTATASALERPLIMESWRARETRRERPFSSLRPIFWQTSASCLLIQSSLTRTAGSHN